MKIKRLSITDLHGYLSFDIRFFSELTFLIGINGSGKTSAVRALMALITPALRDLARIDFKRIEVTVLNEGKETTINATRTESELSLGIDGVRGRLTIPVLSRPSYAHRIDWTEHELEFFREQELVNAGNPVLERLGQLPTPMFLDLERKAQVGVVRRSIQERPSPRQHAATPTLFGGTLIESLRDAQQLAEDAFRKNQAQQRVLADRLKQNLILTHFRINDGDRSLLSDIPSREQVRQLKARQRLVNNSLDALGIEKPEIEGTVADFFTTVYELADKLRGRHLLDLLSSASAEAQLAGKWFAIQPQLERINRVIEHVENYNKHVESVSRRIQRYLDLVNQFLRDSGKEIAFSQTGDLGIAIKAKKSIRPVTALSSGERQLLVILTHLAFNDAARKANILIIDEPELSLHIKWQEQFVGALQGASDGLQLILATHSPSIIMDREAACVDMEEASR